MSDLLKVENLTVRFEVKRGGGWNKKSYLYAVDDVSFTVKKGETLAIVGESGSGKTTAALAVARLVKAYSGKVALHFSRRWADSFLLSATCPNSTSLLSS